MSTETLGATIKYTIDGETGQSTEVSNGDIYILQIYFVDDLHLKIID